ncbi:hypothetical protein BGX27_005525 [Mortierella sp. AM989]|nr:hypothetical protein BGX27_005525 [Mortierella sp. AM989]
MGIYRPLVVTALLEGCLLPECSPPAPMRMNLVASSREDPRILYIVNRDVVVVYHFSTLTPSGLPVVTKRLTDPRCASDDFTDRTINVIKVEYLGTEEVLVTADETGDVCVWFTMDLQRDPLLLSVTESAWGIAIHSEQRLIAVSCNAHTVTVFHCGIDSRLSQRLLFGDIQSSASDTIMSTSSMPSTSSIPPPSSERASVHTTTGSIPSPPLLERASQQILRGHDHNIPNIAFSPCGNFIASTSVDRTCRTWRLSDGKQMEQKSLGTLWGWGVSFVDNDSWMTLTRAEYKKIPKDHLRPGKLPGQNVRDSPLSTTAFSQRRLPPGRDFRMIRSRWFAGPLHNTSCDELETEENEGDERRRAMDGGEGFEDNDDMDDRDAALFGMDDDEGEDEWEDMSSDADDIDDDEDEVASRRATNVTPVQDATDTSADTGDDGDNEGTGVDTEDGGGFTTEDGTIRSTIPRSIKADALRRSAMTPLTRALNHHESSSEQEQLTATSSRSVEVDSVTMSEAESAIGNMDQSAQGVQGGERSEGREGEEIDVNQDPSFFVHLSRAEHYPNGRHQNSTNVEAGSAHSIPTPLLPTNIQQPRPQYPSELLLCATSRNIYLLGRHPPPPPPPPPEINAATEDRDSSPSPTMGWSGDHLNLIARAMRRRAINDAIDDEDHMPALTDMAAHGEYLNWLEEQTEEEGMESEYDPDYDTDPYYEDMGEFMDTADEGQGNSDDDDDDDYGDQYEDADEDMDEMYNADNAINPTVLQLYTLSVARAAATRADGRRFHFLEHFDRLFVMLLVPELSVLVAASQKGSVTIFRLIRVLDDAPSITPTGSSTSLSSPSSPSTLATMSASTVKTTRVAPTTASKSKAKSISARWEETAETGDKDNEPLASSSSQPATISVQGAQYVLFPELYLPRLEPPPQPLIGVSVVPLQRSTASYPADSSYSSSTRSFQHATTIDPSSSDEPGGPRESSDRSSNSDNNHIFNDGSSSNEVSNRSSSSASFMLHLVYMDTQFYSYEIRLRNEKDDPVGLNNVFV